MIVTENLTKHFVGKNILLKNISIVVNRGECVAFVGDENSGVSELMRLFVGSSIADSGRLWVNGKTPNVLSTAPNKMKTLERSKLSTSTTYAIYDTLSVKSMLGKDPKNCDKYLSFVKKCEEELGIPSLYNTKLRALSAGEREKVDFIKRLYENPQIMFLTEPFIALDVLSKEKICGAVKSFCKEFGRTVVVACGSVANAQNFCDRIFLLTGGEIVFSGKPNDFKRKHNKYRQINFSISGGYPNFEDIPVKSISYERGVLTVNFDSEIVEPVKIINEVIKACKVNEIYVTEPDIDKIFKSIKDEP